ncbi:hypothetical protein DFQ27_005175 [Actinomortierella ambigua]|uniref:Mannosylglycerate hydrolase MGH1-like glycoside hydrolase domain-containing protein n=1 Tax=Actinomortierella ambigua TaxID=1343610 RepID=A0A9P6Q1B9_9FUNG|nr:hypothetical protein DFQ27_005175 [Actinomortierella ambigua]
MGVPSEPKSTKKQELLLKTKEVKRLTEANKKKKHWKRWGPYLSERQWVREDYSANGDAWDFFPHDHARSRVYRWGEDGLAGVSDNHQRLCFSVALWNGKDKILKERLFGLTNNEGNHGEDVKELYYYLDNTPTHSYMKARINYHPMRLLRYLYKYPQNAFPYDQLIAENAKRTRKEPEYELMDTGIFKNDEYFDVFVEYAKDGEDVDDVYVKITAFNRSKTDAPLTIVPQFWFRNSWSWYPEGERKVPSLAKKGENSIETEHFSLKKTFIHYGNNPLTKKAPELVFTNNETNQVRLFQTKTNKSPFVKDGFHEYIIDGKKDAVNHEGNAGTKAAGIYRFDKVPAGGSVEVRVRFNNKTAESSPTVCHDDMDKVFKARLADYKQYMDAIIDSHMSGDLRGIQRQSLAGMLWTKQWYHFDQYAWLHGDPVGPKPPASRLTLRNTEWSHMYVDDILSMPDKWEYPFFAAWDMAFHAVALAIVDPVFAKKQLDVMTREWYMHPSGQLAAYEWNFSDVNPPVHAWATLQVFKTEIELYGYADYVFLERVFQKLLLNFTWWVNRKDVEGNNVFEGGFLGLDNIGLFNRSEPLPNGGTLRQADGTAWMSFFSLNMLYIALELARKNAVYEDIASKFLEHFFHISDAMTYVTKEGQSVSLWDTEDMFYYDSVRWRDGVTQRLKTRSLVGLIPLYSVLSLDPEYLDLFPNFTRRLKWLLDFKASHGLDLTYKAHETNASGGRLMALVDEKMLRAILKRLLDENEFLSDYGIRSLSKYHKDHPLAMHINHQEFRVDYLPAESDSGMFGGNSNWRGPIWIPTNYLVVASLRRFHYFFGPDFKVECPTGSGVYMNLLEVSEDIQMRLLALVQRDNDGNRACNGGDTKANQDPNFKDHVLFYEYFDAETGKGLGASHQTGWTGLLAMFAQRVGDKCRMPPTCHKNI